MEVNQLRYLMSVIDEGSFTGAADLLGVSQSAVSAQVAKLERQLGHTLVDRRPGTLRATSAGEAVLPLVRTALASIDEITSVADEMSGLVRGRVRMGMIRGCAIPPFLDALARYRRAHPGVVVTLGEADSSVLQRQVVTGELDLALIGWAGDVLDGLAATVVIDEPLVAVVAEGHRLARRTRLRLDDLTGERLLCLPTGTGIRAALDDCRRHSGAHLAIDLEASSPDTLLGLARRGAGVAVLTASMTAGQAGVATCALRDCPTTAKVGVVIRGGDVPAAATRVLHADLLDALT